MRDILSAMWDVLYGVWDVLFAGGDISFIRFKEWDVSFSMSNDLFGILTTCIDMWGVLFSGLDVSCGG